MVQYIVVDEQMDESEWKKEVKNVEEIIKNRNISVVSMKEIEAIELKKDDEIYLITNFYEKMIKKLPDKYKDRIASIIHTEVELPYFYEFGKNVRIDRNVDLGMDITLGNNVRVDKYVNISHDSIVGNNCYLHYRVTIAGDCKLGDNIVIKEGAVIKEETTIGSGSYIEAGAVVLKDVPPESRVMGNPARIIR